MTEPRLRSIPTRNARQRPNLRAVRVFDGGRRGVPATVTVRRAHAEALETEVTALAAESRDFAAAVRAHAYRLYLAAEADRLDLALHEAAAIVTAADRHLRQRGAS